MNFCVFFCAVLLMQKCDLISAKQIYKDVFVDQENSPLPARLKLWNTDQQSNNFKGVSLKECSCISGISDCCSQSVLATDPEEAYQMCPQMVSSAQSPEVDSTFYLTCNPKDDCQISECSWRLPGGTMCTFKQSNSTAGTVCAENSRVTLTDNLAVNGAGCSIRVSGASSGADDGDWKCMTKYVTPFSGKVTVKVDTGLTNQQVTLTAGTIMGITIPAGLILIAVIVILIICCCCPNCCTRCRRQGKDSDAKSASHYSEPKRTTSKVLPPPPPRTTRDVAQRSQPQIPVRPTNGRNTFGIEEEEESDSSFSNEPEPQRIQPGQRRTGYPPYVYTTETDPVVYTHVRTESGLLQPGAHQPKTARKISNTTSLHSFSTAPQKQTSAKKISVM